MSQAGIVDFEGTHPQVPTSFVTNTGTAIPIGNVLEILGSVVTAHNIPLETVGSGNTVTIVSQYSSAAASSVGTNAGFSSFNSSEFTVDSNGFVSLNGSAVADTITGNTGGPLSPIAGNWNIFGTSTAPGTIPVQTSGSGNTLTTQVQRSQAIASTNASNVGLSAFNSTYFTVDANGFVSLISSAIGGQFTVDAFTAPGTNPVVPNGSGIITITGSQVAAGTTINVIRTDSLAANTYAVQIQRSQAVASSTVGDNGVSHFNSTYFTVDANGFVSLNGSAVGETITGNTGGALSPTSGNWNILGTSTAAGTTPVQTAGSGSTLTVQVQRTQAIASTNSANVGMAAFSSANFSVDANGFVTLNGSAVLETLSDDVNTIVTPSSGNIQLLGHVVEQGATKFSTVVAGTHVININPMSPARWIVDPLGFNGTHTTIGAALTSATSGDTIFIMPGSYTENLTLKAGVNLVAFSGDSSIGSNPNSFNVKIIGKLTASFAGSCSISNICLQTNSDFILVLSGSNITVVSLDDCYINATNNTAFSLTSSGTPFLNLNYCYGTLDTTGITFFSSSSGSVKVLGGFYSSPGDSTTASTFAGSSISLSQTNFLHIISISGIGVLNAIESNLGMGGSTFVTLAGTSSATIDLCQVTGGTASAISIGSGCIANVNMCEINSTNTNAITGAGTLNYSALAFIGSSSNMNVTTQSGGTLIGGKVQAPSAGFLGEQIRSQIGAGAAVTLTNNSPSTVVSISLTPGVWDISFVCSLSGATTGSYNIAAISVNNNSLTGTTQGDNRVALPFLTSGASETSLCVPAYRQIVTSTTIYYLVAQSGFTVGTQTAYGRISANRAG